MSFTGQTHQARKKVKGLKQVQVQRSGGASPDRKKRTKFVTKTYSHAFSERPVKIVEA